MKLLFYYPSIFAFIYYTINGFGWNKVDLVDNVLSSTVVYLVYLLLRKTKLNNIYLILGLAFIYITIGLELTHVCLYDSRIDISSLYVILESNSSEVYEYIQTFSNSKLIFLLLIYFTPLFLFRWVNYIPSPYIRRVYSKIITIVSFIVLSLAAYYSYSYNFIFRSIIIENDSAFLAAYSGYSYYNEMKTLALLEENLNEKFTGLIHKTGKSTEINIIIIGESTSRNHMSLYGYNRSTSPFLSKLKDKLYIYNDVVSPYPQTIRSLKKVLTLGNYENPKNTTKGSIIQLMDKIGYDTYWVSNQRKIGFYDTFITYLTKSARKQIFISPNQNYITSQGLYDERLIPIIKKIIDADNKKVFIFIHLMGTHTFYPNRYPEEFSFFNTNLDLKKQNNINAYDNAVRYNDYVISEILKMVKAKNVKSFVMYFSDHGEDVYDTSDKLLGHSYSKFTKPMFEIPFILYLSDEYKSRKDLVFKTNRAYMMDDLIFSVSDLMDVKFDGYDESRSIFSKNFKERKRNIMGDVNYDSIIQKKHIN